LKISRGDIFFSLAILLGIAVLAALLYLHSRERNAGSGKAIGKVFYKHEIAMRKFSDRMVWDEVESGSPLYANDAVMTGSLSDAELVLDSGLKLKLEANTLIELDLTQEGLTLRLAGGGIKTAGMQNTQTLVKTAGGQSINVTEGDASIRSEGKQVAVEVKEGKVEVTAKDGKKEIVAKGEILSAGKKERVALAIAEPAEDAVYLADGGARVAFACAPANAAMQIQLAKSGNFLDSKRIILANGAASIQVTSGDWFLRCTGAENAVSAVRRFRVVSTGGYKIFRPEKSEIIFNDKATLQLEFQPPRSVATTRVEIADNAQFANPVFSENSNRTALQIRLPQAGKYYYRLTPGAESVRVISQLSPITGSVNFVQTTAATQVASISVEEKLPAVSKLYPLDAKTVDISKTDALHLQWHGADGANAYEVKIFQKRRGKMVLIDTQTTRGTALQISNFKKFSEGDVVWEVRALQKDKTGRVNQRSEPVRSTVQLSFGAQLAAPEIVPVVE